MSESDNERREEESALALEDRGVLAPAAPVTPAVNSFTVAQLATMSRLVADALTLPRALQGKPADVLAIMLTGRELGIGPMQSTRQIDIISGTPALRAELKLALARRAGHDIRPILKEPGRCRVKCITHDSHEVEWALSRDPASPDAVIASEIEVEAWEDGPNGKREKVVAPLVQKANWRSWGYGPMLWARAVAQLCREHCPEAVGGLYSSEELGHAGGDE